MTFKVNAVIKHSPQSGYTNYYINDLDEKTGSYVYTQDNGNDFAYLQNYTNKVVTVYLTALNCVSSSSGCKYRFLPVEVIDENYKFDADKNAANFALDYYATNQFSESYYVSPDLEVITSLSSDLLGFSDAKISYESDNNNVAYFENIDNKTIFKLKDEGAATIKITAKYNDDIQTRTVKVNKLKLESYETITIKEATSSEDNSDVTVKGIVSASLGGKKLSSFYLIDNTGSVVVTLVNSDDLKNLSIGNQVIVKGKKTHYVSDKTSSGIGQIQIEDASVLVNNYGDNSIPTDSFISKTISELYEIAYDSLVDHSHEIYTIKAKASKVETPYYINYYLGDDNKKLILYASNGDQYQILDKYLYQELTFNVALVFWNSNNYKLNLIDIVLNDGTIINYNTTLKK